jgi:DNA topoisomerase II
MKKDSVTVTLRDWIEPKYKEYSIYACTKRSLPHLIDGLKPSQRKIVYTAMRRAKSFIKVVSLSGYCLAEASYHHGDSSLNEAISLMGKDYVGANNYPLFDGDGGFGNKFGDSHSAPRYIYVKNSKIFDDLFLKEDEPILEPSGNLEDPEPAFYLPIIPYVLLNGISGIAVGFSVDIPSYNPNDIIENIENILSGKKARKEMVPYYKGYTGEIKKESDCWIMYGKIKRINTTTIEITELPIDKTTENYKNFLNGLIDTDVIKDYDDLSDSSWRFIVRAPRNIFAKTDDELYELFNLKFKIQERLNVIYNNVVTEYESPIKLIEDFTKIRLGFYEKRKNNILMELRLNIIRNFIKMIVNKYIINKKEKMFDKNEVIEYVKSKKNMLLEFCGDNLEGVLLDVVESEIGSTLNDVVDSLRLNDIYSDKVDDFKKKIFDTSEEYNVLYRKTIETLYRYDLKQLSKRFE